MVTFASLSRLYVAASLMGLVSTAHAQTAAPFTPSMPSVPQASYPSAFKDYNPYLEEPVGNWKAANENVARIGGWREYARQAQQPENTPATKAGDVKQKATP